MPTNVTITFAKGGYIMTTVVDGKLQETVVFNSTGKLNRALRQAIDELTLLPKKDDKETADE